MWRNYLTVGVRALSKNRTYAFINIIGLAIGMAACLMILLSVRYERSYDAWLPNAEQVYQVQTTFRDPDTGERDDLQMSPYVTGRTLTKDFPQIARQVYALGASPVVLRGGQAIPIEDAIQVDNLFFDVLPLPLVKGDPKTALRNVGSVVLSESEARRLFGAEDPIGRTLTLVNGSDKADHRVTGIMRDLPRNSHLRFTLVARFDPQTAFATNPGFLSQWGTMGGWNYVVLRDGADVDAIRAALPQWEKRNIPDQRFGDRTVNQGDVGDWDLVPVRDVHLGRAQGGAMTAGNDHRSIATFAVVAVLILAMACVNFTNLATARASQRAREVALRKVLGATRRQLISQFIAESVLVAGLAMLLSLTLVELLLPLLAHFLDADLTMRYFGADGMLLPILLLVLLVGAAGGVYPAFYLSRFQPAQVLKANKSTAEAEGSGRLRSVLVVGQFAVSIALIICTAVVYGQTVHARTADPGYARQGLLQVDIGARPVPGGSETLAREVARLEGVTGVGRTAIGIATRSQNNNGARIPGRQEPINLGSYTIDDGFFRTMGMKIVAGRGLDHGRQLDVDPRPWQPTLEDDRALVARGVNVVVNELAARRLGYRTPADAIGAQFGISIAAEEAGLVPMTVVGVVKDSRLRSIREPIEPLVFRLSERGFNALVVRYDSHDPAAVRDRVEAVWKRLAPDVPFDAQFSEEIVAELYQAEQARAASFAGFALLAVIVACLGLFGLAAFTAERRTKEIGIRKVLGARTHDIVRLLAWQFSKPVIVANLIAWPAAWWVMRDWLNHFDSRIDLGPTPFLLAGGAALAIALGTIAGHAFRVARSNPINALRYE
ncbi:FtsX-like permease family protein [Sphingomonas parva]|uniref:FtsX-like permease family protein n=1 Tax=Sphingomonas parva TaxID=2555898 RepID=A0A4Y8ZVS3_9SPHN|nr:ABC transporter permease [Sphingomonas parva]TFI59422.1 FtsX-like permease family protein [Sphingomonas parva]